MLNKTKCPAGSNFYFLTIFSDLTKCWEFRDLKSSISMPYQEDFLVKQIVLGIKYQNDKLFAWLLILKNKLNIAIQKNNYTSISFIRN